MLQSFSKSEEQILSSDMKQTFALLSEEIANCTSHKSFSAINRLEGEYGRRT